MNKLTLDALDVVVAIHRRGSFAAAAAELDRVPSAISYTVQKLEEELGTALFRKEGRRAVLTPAGMALVNGGSNLLKDAEQLVEQVQQIATGWEPSLSIAIDTAVDREPIWRAVEKVLAEHPALDLKICEQVLGGTWEVLFDDTASLIIGAVEHLPGRYEASRQGLRILPWLPVETCFVAAPSHPICKASEPLSAETITAHRGVVIADTSQRLGSLSRGQFDSGNVLYVDNMQEKMTAHLKGLGVGLLPVHLAADHLQSGALVTLKTESGVTSEPTSLAYRISNRGKALNFILEQLIAERDAYQVVPLEPAMMTVD